MTDDPREILKAAGVECAEVEAYFHAPVGNIRAGSIGQVIDMVGHDEADAAIIALARLVAKQAEQLKQLTPTGGPDYRVTTGPGCEHGPWCTYPGGGGT